MFQLIKGNLQVFVYLDLGWEWSVMFSMNDLLSALHILLTNNRPLSYFFDMSSIAYCYLYVIGNLPIFLNIMARYDLY